MTSIKKKIKKIVPQRILYLVDLYRTFKEYIKFKESRNNDFKIEKKVDFYTDDETINMIVNEKKSLARFGDGELMWMSGEEHKSFQKYSPEMGKDLLNAFCSTNPNLLIGIPIGVYDSKGCNLNAKLHWRMIRDNFIKRIDKIINYDKKYVNASITRPYIDYKSRIYSEKCFINLKKIWNNRKIVIVEGKDTKLGIGNDLLDNAKSIRRIICPSENAYFKIDEIEKSILDNCNKNDLILCALGPTASILADRISKNGIQFVDIGHVDVEYMWYKKKAIIRIPLDGKYVNESGEKCDSDFYSHDVDYQNSIIKEIENE